MTFIYIDFGKSHFLPPPIFALGFGAVIVEQVRSPSEMRGFAARSEASTDRPATEILREKREQDRDDRDAQFSAEE